MSESYVEDENDHDSSIHPARAQSSIMQHWLAQSSLTRSSRPQNGTAQPWQARIVVLTASRSTHIPLTRQTNAIYHYNLLASNLITQPVVEKTALDPTTHLFPTLDLCYHWLRETRDYSLVRTPSWHFTLSFPEYLAWPQLVDDCDRTTFWSDRFHFKASTTSTNHGAGDVTADGRVLWTNTEHINLRVLTHHPKFLYKTQNGVSNLIFVLDNKTNRLIMTTVSPKIGKVDYRTFLQKQKTALISPTRQLKYHLTNDYLAEHIRWGGPRYHQVYVLSLPISSPEWHLP